MLRKNSITTQLVGDYFKKQGEEITGKDTEKTFDLMHFLNNQPFGNRCRRQTYPVLSLKLTG